MISRPVLVNKFKYDIVHKVLNKAPIVGLYKNEKPKYWKSFFKIFCKFLKSEEGPRGQAIKISRQYLKKDKKMTEQMLEPLNLNKNYLIRDVYVKFKAYIPSPLFIKYQIDSQKLRQVEDNVKLFRDKDSYVYNRIVMGLREKHGDKYDIASKMKQIVELYVERYRQKRQQVKSMELELKASQKYLKYEKMREYLNPVIDVFDKVERQIGVSNVERGKIFEQKCQTEGLKQLFSRLGRSDYEVITNSRWEPYQLGEVDIALMQTINGVKTATVLIECKARLFDIRAGVKQIGPERIQKNKRFLRVHKEIVPVLDDSQYFIMTSMPSNDYHLPFESRLKAELEKVTKGFAYSELDPDKIYHILADKFNNETSPLDWFNQQAAKHLIIV